MLKKSNNKNWSNKNHNKLKMKRKNLPKKILRTINLLNKTK